MFDFEIAVVIPMAGLGERFPSPCPKQYFKISGKPLFLFCVERFVKFPYIKKICLVCDNVKLVRKIIEENFERHEKIILATGGSSRHKSIKNGLLELKKYDTEHKIVVVHDAVRPIVPEELLINIIENAVVHGAAGATRPLISTVVKSQNDGNLECSLDRNFYLMSETPQAFLFSLILSAYEKCSDMDLEQGTECLQLTLKYCGIKAKLIPGPDVLWKITDKKDFYSFVQYLKELSTDVCLLGKEESRIIKEVQKSLQNKVNSIDCFLSETKIKSPKLFNTIICFHSSDIDQGSPMCSFDSILDVDRQGLIIHVIEYGSSDNMKLTSVYELHRSGKNLVQQYEKLNKGVVKIHFLSLGEEKKLVELITSLIFIDAEIISGQVLFL